MADLREQYEGRTLLLRHACEQLKARTIDALSRLEHIDRVHFRVKGTESFVKKAVAGGTCKYAEPLIEIEDQIAGRIIVFFVSDIPLVRDVLMTLFHPIEVRTREPERDAEFGYQSEHLVFTIPVWSRPPKWDTIEDSPRTFEVQLRTLFMHAYAEPEHNLQYKSANDLDPETRRELGWIAASAWGADSAFERIRTRISPSH
jgi:putative GTP pyrophosphokinase